MNIQPDAIALKRDYACMPDRLIPLCHWRTLSATGKELGKTPTKEAKDWPKEQFDFAAMIAHAEDGKNVGFKLGDGTGVVDYDPRRDPAGDALKRLCADFGIDLAKCFVVETGGGGVHAYMSLPAEWRGREQDSRYPGIEWKHGARRYVVAAGSVHPNGKRYIVRQGSPPLDKTAEVPATLLEAFAHLTPPDNARGQGPESFGNFTSEQLGDTLTHIPPQTFGAGAIPSWEQFMMSCHWMTGGAGREEFVAWSISDPAYSDHEEIIRKRWDSCTPRADSIKTGLIFKTLERLNVDREHWPTEGAGVLFADVEMTAEELESIGVAAVDPLPPGVQQLGKATSYSFDALSNRMGDLPPFLDGFFYGNAGGIYVVYGEPKSGKSLLVSSLCLAVAGGDKEWMGRKLWLHGPVRWFALESPHSLIMAGKAWMKRTGRPHPDIRFTFNGEGFVDKKWMDELEMLCRGCRVAVIDTFTMAIPGLDQNSPEAASMLFSKLNEVGRRTGTTFIVIHHSTKADGRNARGSNAIIGNSDGSVAVLKEGAGEIRVEAMAVRYGPDGGELDVQIEQVFLGRDPLREGQMLSGPYLTQIEWEDDGVAPPSPLDFIATLAKDHGQPRGDAFVLPRSDIKKLTGKAEPNAVQAIFRRWTGQHVGNGYTLDVERADKNNAHMLVVRITSLSILSAEELSAHGDDLAGLT